MAQILCSTGALIGKANNWDYTLLLPLSEKLCCDGFEFMMYGIWYDCCNKIIDFFNSNKLKTPVIHCEKHIGEAFSRGNSDEVAAAIEKFYANCHIANEIGATKLVLHLWNGFASDQNFNNNLSAYEKVDEIAKNHSLELLVENVVCNKENPLKHWIELYNKYPDIKFIYDTKMAAFHNQDTLIYENEYARLWNHIRHFHVNDYAGGYMDWENLKTLPIGHGKVNFERFFEFINKIGYDDTFTVEATAFNKSGEIDIRLLNMAFKKIREYHKN